jgi:3-deoxy-7-phosphoheptulonate synthase
MEPIGHAMISVTTWRQQAELSIGPIAEGFDPVGSLPAQQQPDWTDGELVQQVREELAGQPALVTEAEVGALRSLLAAVAARQMQVVQAGDCAEDPAECTPGHVAHKVGLLDALAAVLRLKAGKPVIRVGRIAGQFGKPRSRPTDRYGDLELPAYRGHMVNSPEPDPELRRPDPRRLVLGYQAASAAMDALRRLHGTEDPRAGWPVWTSHEALLLDYEVPLLRQGRDSRLVLASTHWPWIGNRTRQVDGAHVALLAAVANPVACKLGPGTATEEVLTLCERLDPDREPGRLTLIARMGADEVAGELPPLVAAVRASGHPVIWLCDPTHGNTVHGPGGRKTRFVESVIREVEGFHAAVTGAGGVAGGLHLEATPDDVTECVTDPRRIHDLGRRYTTLCDPRLNPLQAFAVAFAWGG